MVPIKNAGKSVEENSDLLHTPMASTQFGQTF
jgi:hypothetical protein